MLAGYTFTSQTRKSQKTISEAQHLSFLSLSLNEEKVMVANMLKVAHANMCANPKHAVLVSAHFHIYQLISAISKTKCISQLTVRILTNFDPNQSPHRESKYALALGTSQME